MVEATMDEEARLGFLGASGRIGLSTAIPAGWLGVGVLRGLYDAPAGSGSAGRHTDVPGPAPQVGYSQEVAPDWLRFGQAAA